MEKYIEHNQSGNLILIPVDPRVPLAVRYVPYKCPEKQGFGEVDANIGSLSFMLYGDVSKEESDELIRGFVDRYKEACKEKEYVSTGWVVVVCVLVVAAVLALGGSGDKGDNALLRKELENIRVTNEVFSPSEQVVDDLLEIPDERVLDVIDAKERYLAALEQMKEMDAGEREAFINTPQMQELINTSWVKHIRQE